MYLHSLKFDNFICYFYKSYLSNFMVQQQWKELLITNHPIFRGKDS